MKLFLLVFLVLFLKVECSSEVNVRIEALSMYEKADQRWEEFKREAQSFLSERERSSKHATPTDAFEKILLEKMDEQNKEFIETFLKAQKQFVELRDTLAHLFFLDGTGSYADCSSATAALDITDWYTQYLEKRLFKTVSTDHRNGSGK